MSILELTKLIGLLSLTSQAVLPAQINFRYLQQQMQALKTKRSYCKKVILKKLQGSTAVVDTKLKNLQWSLLDSVSQSSANTDRCIQKELGCSKSRGINRGAMVKEGTVATNKCISTESSRISTLTFNKQKSLKEIHFQIGNTTALLYLVKIGGGGDREPSVT